MDVLIVLCAKYLIFLVILVAGFFTFFKYRSGSYVRNGVVIFGSAFLAWFVAHFLKDSIAHPRPDVIALIVPDDTYSFPSGHTTFLSALAFSMFYFDRKAGVIIFISALIVGAARVLAGVHFWYDIVGGVVVGAVVSSCVIFFFKSFWRD